MFRQLKCVIWIRDRRKACLIGGGILIALLLLLILLLCIPYGGKSSATLERTPTDHIDGIPLYTELIPEDTEARPGIPRQIRYIVIHETGNPSVGADARAHSAYLLDGGDGTTSWHYTVDDRQIYHHVPDTEVAWHAGDKLTKNGGNLNGIGVELCINEDGDFEKTFQNGAKLAAYLLDAYQLSITSVKQHHDFNGKDCPEQIRHNNRWQEFLDAVQSYRNQGS